ncbi:MAG: ATP-binding protein [Anaerolineales bacterium]
MNNTELPSGTVTFLFTDIEGSTLLLAQLGDDYANLLADQRTILREVFTRHEGQEVDTQGDSFFVSFARASQAVSAATEIQRMLQAHEWPDGVDVRVRMGLHTGEPLRAEEGYVGMDVHRAARIAHAGHGGQVLLSPTTTSLVEHDLPDDIRLKDLGEHRLKDLQHPLRISQLIITELATDFPPLQTLDALPNNLPSQLTTFVGRDDEIARVKELLRETRLVTLVGPGGTGKTRLSLQVAADLVETFPQGVWFVDLTAVESPDEMMPAIAEAMRFKIDVNSNLAPKQQVVDFLSRRSCLLVLDNFEHLIEGAGLLTELIQHAPDVHLLVTSRERLNLREEWIFDVGGMSYPQNGRDSDKVYSGLHLFKERAQQVDNEFVLSNTVEPHAVRICQLMDGSPLGIELSAAWVATLPCSEIVREIEKNLDFVVSTMRDLPQRHRSLRAVFEHSWQLLSEGQRASFQRLSIFRGGFSRQAAEQVAGVNLTMLAEFMSKSLIRQSVEGRYDIHGLLRQYAQEQLSLDSEEQQAVKENHSHYFARFLQERRDALDREQTPQLRDEIRPDISNLKEAVNHAFRIWEEAEALGFLRDFCAFYRSTNYYEGLDVLRKISRGLRDDGIEMELGSPRGTMLLAITAYECAFESSLGSSEHEQVAKDILPILRETELTHELANCLLALGVYRVLYSDYSTAIANLSESTSLFESFNDLYGLLTSMSWLGWAYKEMGDLDRGGEIFQDAYELSKREGSRLGQAYTLSKLGTWSDARHEFEEALGYHQKAQVIFIEFNDVAGQGYALSRMSLSAWGTGDFKEALSFGNTGLEQFESIGHRWGINTSYCRIGFAEVDLGEYTSAESHFRRALDLAIENQFPAIASYALIGIAAVRNHQKHYARAAELLGFANSQKTTPALYKYLADLEISKLEAHLSPEQLQGGLAKGSETEFDQLIRSIQSEQL